MVPFKVMIVEDDFMVAEINKGLTEKVAGFRVVKIAKNGKEAIKYLARHEIDLIILDIYLPDMHGIEIVKKTRRDEYPVDFILITAAHDAHTIEDSVRFGVFDYIVKPFDAKRYGDSLKRYRRLKHSMKSNVIFDQKKVDGIYSYDNSEDELPKGIARYTLDRIEKAVDSYEGSFSTEDVMKTVSLSRITIRRYLEYLLDKGLLLKSYHYKKKGRPTIIYNKQNE